MINYVSVTYVDPRGIVTPLNADRSKHMFLICKVTSNNILIWREFIVFGFQVRNVLIATSQKLIPYCQPLFKYTTSPFITSTKHFLFFLFENASRCLFWQVCDLHSLGAIRGRPAVGMVESWYSQMNWIRFSFPFWFRRTIWAGGTQIIRHLLSHNSNFSRHTELYHIMYVFLIFIFTSTSILPIPTIDHCWPSDLTDPPFPTAFYSIESWVEETVTLVWVTLGWVGLLAMDWAWTGLVVVGGWWGAGWSPTWPAGSQHGGRNRKQLIRQETLSLPLNGITQCFSCQEEVLTIWLQKKLAINFSDTKNL